MIQCRQKKPLKTHRFQCCPEKNITHSITPKMNIAQLLARLQLWMRLTWAPWLVHAPILEQQSAPRVVLLSSDALLMRRTSQQMPNIVFCLAYLANLVASVM